MTPPRRSSTKPDPGSPSDWLAHAKSDLNIARLARDRADVLPAQVCFHAQQAAEKALKAVVMGAAGLVFPAAVIREIRARIAKDEGLTRTELSREVCEWMK